MIDYNEIRQSIIGGKMDVAFNQLFGNSPIDYKNEITLLWAQINHWEKNNRLNLGAQIEERNRIIYATLHIITQIEKETKKGIEKNRLNNLAIVEEDLAKGFEKLVSLRKNGAIDLFMIWLLKNEPEVFQVLVKEEKINGKANGLARTLATIDLEQFISEFNLETSVQEVHDYLLRKNEELPKFFSGWLAYNDYREKFANDLSNEIEKYKQKHQSLLKTGVIGAILGVASFNVFERTMDKVIELHESGMPDTDSPIFNESDDDDDDDD